LESGGITDYEVTDSRQLPITLRPDRQGMFFLIVVSLVFVAISWWVARLGNAVGYLGVAFFGLGLVVRNQAAAKQFLSALQTGRFHRMQFVSLPHGPMARHERIRRCGFGRKENGWVELGSGR
jgi:hypothetical protein